MPAFIFIRFGFNIQSEVLRRVAVSALLAETRAGTCYGVWRLMVCSLMMTMMEVVMMMVMIMLLVMMMLMKDDAADDDDDEAFSIG